MSSFTRKLLRHLRRSDKVSRLPTHLITPGDRNGAEVWPILASSRAKDETEVARLMVEYGVDNAADLLAALPALPRPTFRQRLMDWLRRIEGSTAYDPLHAAMRRAGEDRPRVKVRYFYD